MTHLGGRVRSAVRATRSRASRQPATHLPTIVDVAPDLNGAAATKASAPGMFTLLRRFVMLVGAPVRFVAFAVLSLVAGLAEAAVILLVVAGVGGLAQDGGQIQLAVGPIESTFALSTVIWLSVAGTILLVTSQLASARLAAGLGEAVLKQGRRRLMRGLLQAPWEIQSGVTSSRFQDLLSVQSLRMANLVVLLSNFLTAMIAFSAMVATALLVEPVTAMVLLVLGVALGAVFRPVTRRIRDLSLEHLRAHQEYVERTADLFGVLPETRIYGVRDEAQAVHDAHSRDLASRYRRMRFAGAVQPALYLGIVMLLLIAGLAAVSRMGTVDLALVGAILLVLLRGTRYSQQAQTRWQSAVEMLPYLADFEEVLAAWGGPGRRRGTRTLERVGTLELRDLRYTYPTGDPGLQGVDLTIEPGTVVGLAGPSGSGKSTLAQILLGLREPTAGEYLVDGEPATAFDEASWFARFAYVAQQPVLLEGDVRYNVRFLREQCSDRDVDAALSAAALDADLAEWPDGASRQVGSAGSEISGGQRQRIAIARALVEQPDVLVLDEPTSALDPDSERVIRETLGRLRGHLTVVLIAHRESTLDVCDVVVRLTGGRVASIERRSAGTPTGVTQQPHVSG